MYYHVKAMYDQWSNGQSHQDCASRREVFIAMVCYHIGHDTEMLRQFLNSQDWFPKPIDQQKD